MPVSMHTSSVYSVCALGAVKVLTGYHVCRYAIKKKDELERVAKANR
jgi:ribosomal protein S7